MPKVVDTNSRRAEFLKASWALIAREGIGAATLRAVSAEAGQTTGALTHYFDARDSLLLDALRASYFAARDRMIAASKLVQSPLGRLEAILLEALPLDDERLTEWKVWIAFWGASIGNPILQNENNLRYIEWRSMLYYCLSDLNIGRDRLLENLFSIVPHIDGLGIGISLNSNDPETLSIYRSAAQRQVKKLLNDLARDPK